MHKHLINIFADVCMHLWIFPSQHHTIINIATITLKDTFCKVVRFKDEKIFTFSYALSVDCSYLYFFNLSHVWKQMIKGRHIKSIKICN